MPLVRVDTTARLSEPDRAALCAALSRTCAELLGKPEQYVMVVVHDGAAMSHAGQAGPAAFVDVRSIGGLGPEPNRRLSSRICALLGEAARVPPDRVYLNFVDVPAADWGHDGDTFG